MKKLLFLLLFTNIIYAQTSRVQQDLNNFEPGEIIVKLKDNVDARITYSENGKATSNFNVGELLDIEGKVASSSVLFHQKSIEASVVNREKMKAVYAAKAAANPNNGYTPKKPLTMKNVFVLKTNNQQENILQLIEQIKDNPAVEYAEPNYIYNIDDFEIASDIIYDKDLSTASTTSTTVPNDPLYSQQTNITQTNIDDVWNEYTTGDGSQVVAILDTGVDYTHPDLEANIWINEAELNGVEGYDDDGNGYVDDMRGWDFINNDNAPLDDNMHGTHVAGIVGAVGDNGIGVAGAAWNVKLMPVKVFQSNGQGNTSTIVEGINFASENGATIQNMSFGSYAESATLKSALENAYASSFLVAAAGNDKICIGPGLCPDNSPSAPLYPGAYTFVLGVEDGNGSYDNYDQDGPVYSGYPSFLNYEVKAPGSAIMNTVPNGGYRALTGTSMSTPIVAGAMALYLEQKPDDSNELIFGSLINTSGTNVDIKAAIDVVPTPVLRVLSADIKDEINDQNNNGYWESGETLELFPMIKNYWGPTDDVIVGIDFWEFEDTSKAEIIESSIAIGSMSAYANLQDLNQSLKIKLADNLADNVNIQFKVSVWSGDNQDYLSSHKIIINVTNSIILDGYVESDITLTSNNQYIFNQNIIITNNSTLTIEPGTHIDLKGKRIIVDNDGSKIIANGNKDNFIIITSSTSNWGGISDGNSASQYSYIKMSQLNFGKMNIHLENSEIKDSHLAYNDDMLASSNSVNIIDSDLDPGIGKPHYIGANSHVGLLLNDIKQSHTWHSVGCCPSLYGVSGGAFEGLIDSSIFNFYCADGNLSPEHPIITARNEIGTETLGSIYFGTSSESLFSNISKHFYNSSETIGQFDFSSLTLIPSEIPHGHVWKVLVNGKDAQDEYDLIDPIGIGSHGFKVYFNREMDTTVDPQISYGVREPYNQKAISETGSWSTDGKIYTVTHDVNIGAADGINRIRVQGARDLDYFDIPVEDYRFNILVQSAGTASAGWFATPGLGKIDLEWTAPSADEIDDALGYNMYRYIANVDGTFTDPIKLNESLIVEDTDDATTGVYYTDYNVVEGQTYFYKYNILRTSFETTDYSSVVSTAPLTSTLGDSNGDFTVNVMDLVQDVDYILGNNPSPFIFIAGDVNNDQNINVLDIVGTVDIILNPTAGRTVTNTPNSIDYYSNTPVGDAVFNWEGNDLFVTSNYNIGGIQLAFNQGFEYTLSDNLPGIERLNYTQDDTAVLMLYSFNNTIIANTKTKILTRANASQEFDINLAVVGTTNGAKLNTVLNNGTLGTIDAPFQSNKLELLKLYPNPSDGIVNLQYYLPELMDGVTVKVYDIQGRLVWAKNLDSQVGKTDKQLNLDALKAGNYIVLMSAHKDGGVKYLSHKMLILK